MRPSQRTEPHHPGESPLLIELGDDRALSLESLVGDSG